MSSKTELQKELDKNIPESVITTREGVGGKSLSYLEGWYVIDSLNQKIGQGNWCYSVQQLTKVYEGSLKNNYGEIFSTSYIATVSLTAEIDGKNVYFSDVGYGDGSDKKSPGKAHELAVKEAVTDGIKRAAKNLGRSMGLALYDKEQTYVGNTQVEPQEVKVATPVATKFSKEVVAVATETTLSDARTQSGTGRLTNKTLVEKAFKFLVSTNKETKESLKKKYTDNKGLSGLTPAELDGVLLKLKSDYNQLPL